MAKADAEREPSNPPLKLATFISLAHPSRAHDLLPMKWVSEIREFVAALFGALFAIACYLTLRAWLAGAKDSDWLNFAGVIFGVTLTIGGTKAIDALLNEARRGRQRRDFTLAVRAVAAGLMKCAEAPTPQDLVLHVSAVSSLWRVAVTTINQLPDLDFTHRAAIGVMQDGMEIIIPHLLSHSQIAANTNPGLFTEAKQIAARAGLTVLPVTELFEKATQSKPAPARSVDQARVAADG